MTVWGVDISMWNGPVDHAQVQRDGFGWITVKGSGSKEPDKGALYRDPLWFGNVFKANQTPALKLTYHYLSNHGSEYLPAAQAGLLLDNVRYGGPEWGASVDIEDATVTPALVEDFLEAWGDLTGGVRLVVYTYAAFWKSRLPAVALPPWCRLWQAHYVPESVRGKPGTDTAPQRYASQQAHAINPLWWGEKSGGLAPFALQFTDHALVAQRYWLDASLFQGTRAELRDTLLGLG